MNERRLEALVIARVSVARDGLEPAQIAEGLRRFCPASVSETAWMSSVGAVSARLQAASILDEGGRLRDPAELTRRIGVRDVKRWVVLADRVLPALALGIAPADAKSHKRLASRDDWAAAIVGRALGLWTGGTPPSLPSVCDALAWRELGLTGKPKRFPPEVRALFVQRRLSSDAASPERQVRLLAAREVEAPRAEGRTLRDALVSGWLQDRELGAHRSFDTDVRAVVGEAREGVFGDRKVFISAAWEALRARPGWTALALDDFKSRLLAAHRAGSLSLARADLVAAMDPGLVAASEIRSESASFHFIVRGEAR